MDKRKLKNEGFMPVYKEISDIIGPEATFSIYKSVRGLQITFPKRLYTTEFVLDEICKRGDEVDVHKVVLECDYTERYLRQLLKQIKER